MAAGWQQKAMSVVVAIGATVALASYVEASPTSGTTSSVRVGPVPSPVPGAARPAALPPVTEHPISVPDRGGLPAGSQSVTQVIQVAVIGGPLELATEQATVALERVPGTRTEWIGSLPAVRVVDARGTHEGWEVRWAASGIDLDSRQPSHVPTAKARLQPGEPVVVAGLPEGVEAGKPGPAVPKGRVLFSAEPGTGGGTYEAGGTVSVRLPSAVDATAVTVRLTFTLG